MAQDLVDLISKKPLSKGQKLIKFYAVVMCNYRTALGDKAWDAISALFNDESIATSFAFLMGYNMAGGNHANLLTEETEELINGPRLDKNPL